MSIPPVCVCTAAPLSCGLGCCSRTVVVNIVTAYKHPNPLAGPAVMSVSTGWKMFCQKKCSTVMCLLLVQEFLDAR